MFLHFFAFQIRFFKLFKQNLKIKKSKMIEIESLQQELM